jgi:hypothetical protein
VTYLLMGCNPATLKDKNADSFDVVDLFGGGGWTRTSDLRIMRPSL